MYGVPGVDQEGNGETRPHHPVAEERRQAGPGAVFARIDHLGRQLDQGKDQAFPLHPLLAKDDRDAEHHEVQHQDETEPGGEGSGPLAPGDGPAPGKAFEERPHGLGVLGQQPGLYMGRHVLDPAVFRRGVVHGRHGRKEYLRQSVRRDGRRDKRHDVDDGQFALCEGVCRGPGTQQRVDDTDEDGEEEDHADGRKVAAQVRTLDDHVGVGIGDAQDQRAGHADGHGAGRDHLPRRRYATGFPGCSRRGDRHEGAFRAGAERTSRGRSSGTTGKEKG